MHWIWWIGAVVIALLSEKPAQWLIGLSIVGYLSLIADKLG